MEGYRGNSRGFSHIWEDTVTSPWHWRVLLIVEERASRAFCRCVTRPSGLLLRSAVTRWFSDFHRGSVFLSFWAFSVWKLSRKSKRENDTISWNDLDCRLTKYESDCRPLRGLISIWKWKNSAHPVLSGSWSCTLRRRQLQHENLLQTARKGVGEAGSDFRYLSITSLAKAEDCANRLIEKELAVLWRACEWEKRVWGCSLYYTVRTSSVSAWTLPAFFLAFSFIIWVSQSMLFLHTLSRWRAKPFFSFFFLFSLSLRSYVRSKRCAVSRHSSRVHSHAYSRSAVHWARRDRGKANSYTFWPHRCPAWCTQSCHFCQVHRSERDASTRSRGNHMHDHWGFQRDTEWCPKRLSLYLSISLLLTKGTHAQYTRRFPAWYN